MNWIAQEEEEEHIYTHDDVIHSCFTRLEGEKLYSVHVDDHLRLTREAFIAAKSIHEFQFLSVQFQSQDKMSNV